MNRTITSAGICSPVLFGHQLATYIDQCPAGFGFGLWRDQESFDTAALGSTTTWGIDAGRLRLRFVLDRVGSRHSTGWGRV